MCHVKISAFSDLATSCANIVLPVPGSPFTIIGLSSVIDAFTATLRSSVAIYDLVPSNFMVRFF